MVVVLGRPVERSLIHVWGSRVNIRALGAAARVALWRAASDCRRDALRAPTTVVLSYEQDQSRIRTRIKTKTNAPRNRLKVRFLGAGYRMYGNPPATATSANRPGSETRGLTKPKPPRKSRARATASNVASFISPSEAMSLRALSLRAVSENAPASSTGSVAQLIDVDAAPLLSQEELHNQAKVGAAHSWSFVKGKNTRTRNQDALPKPSAMRPRPKLGTLYELATRPAHSGAGLTVTASTAQNIRSASPDDDDSPTSVNHALTAAEVESEAPEYNACRSCSFWISLHMISEGSKTPLDRYLLGSSASVYIVRMSRILIV
ncbi:unnamed protein product [Peniophora sp. CBMAI 1063]|nr:unnamed protein product [Peniophora sp. CBMAI 1063]